MALGLSSSPVIFCGDCPVITSFDGVRAMPEDEDGSTGVTTVVFARSRTAGGRQKSCQKIVS